MHERPGAARREGYLPSESFQHESKPTPRVEFRKYGKNESRSRFTNHCRRADVRSREQGEGACPSAEAEAGPLRRPAEREAQGLLQGGMDEGEAQALGGLGAHVGTGEDGGLAHLPEEGADGGGG